MQSHSDLRNSVDTEDHIICVRLLFFTVIRKIFAQKKVQNFINIWIFEALEIELNISLLSDV
jgi:hypothetical protein